MQIVSKGQSCFFVVAQRAKQEQVRILIDPFEPAASKKVSFPEADIVLFSQHGNDGDFKTVTGESFVVATPGEYEIKDVAIRGIASFRDNTKGKERGANTIYTIEVEAMRICHLGFLGQHELTSGQVELIGNVDVLMIPTGGAETIGSKSAAAIVHQLEPRLVIPMQYAPAGAKGKMESVDMFLKEMGAKDVQPQQKLSVKPKDLSDEGTVVAVISVS